MSDFDLRDGRLGAVVGRWCYLGGPMERAFLIVARPHSTQPDGAPVELKTLIEYEPRGEAEDQSLRICWLFILSASWDE